MKKLYFIIILALTVFAGSCEKTEEVIVDCFAESILMAVHYSSADETPLTVNFTFSYNSSDHTLDNALPWDFGDGQTQTVSGTTVSHTYAQPGSYTVKASPTIRKGGSSCSTTVTRHINIEQP